ncbi:MAG: UvrB/UvrC motif-containing protein, partial [Minisyncoccia bacterium]
HRPEYNTLGLDDKSYNYVVITKEKFPRVLVVRGKELAASCEQRAKTSEKRVASNGRLAASSLPIAAQFGPFPHGMQLRLAMKIIRHIFPYRDTCTPCIERLQAPSSKLKAVVCRPCFNRQIGLCPGVCTGEISAAEYVRTIRRIKLFFDGRKQTLLTDLTRAMKAAAKAERFEEAGECKRQLFALKPIQDVALIKDEYREPARVRDGEKDRITMRAEAYDVAHLRGAGAIGAMTVVENGEAAKAEYRLFRIRSAKAGDDPGALREILSRRLAHEEWPLPRLIIVDGAAAQMNAAKKILEEVGLAIPVVGVVKDEKHRPREIRPGANASKDIVTRHERSILLANAEAHRFAISRHRKTLRKGIFK